MIPYFELRTIPLGPELSLNAFGTLVLLGVLAGAGFAHHRAARTGIPQREIANAIRWAVGCGFVVSHLAVVLFYEPHLLEEGGFLVLLQFWNGLSSFGGFFGALLGLAIYFRRSGRSWVPHAEILLQALVIGWIFGRLGCALVHDHIGTPSTFLLAIRFPDGPRHDLGLYEFLYTLLVLAPAAFLVNRKPRPPGTTICVITFLYAPVRFLLDFLRNTDLPGAEARYGGLTPAQYACVAVLLIGFHFWSRIRRES